MSKPNTILTLLQGCNGLQRLKKIHAHVIINGLQHHPAISNKLLNFCAISVAGSLSYAQLLFNQIENPPTQAWNSLIRGFAQSPSPLQAIFYYNYMLLFSLSRPDTFTFSFTLKACERVKALNKCQELHGSVIRCVLMAGFQPNSITFLGLLCGFNHQGLVREGVEYFQMMISKFNLKPGIKHYGRAGMVEKVLEVISSSPSKDDPV